MIQSKVTLILPVLFAAVRLSAGAEEPSWHREGIEQAGEAKLQDGDPSPEAGGEKPDDEKSRLAAASSPYVRSHASNPVDWYPWGEEALAAARKQNKPIFLSVGYSTCHWCHVMARESFADPEIAAVMNKHFINIKLDREERPDVDGVYMAFVQATTGQAGWPLSVWLTPELKPFFGGTYFPPENHGGRPGFKSILGKIAEVWGKDEVQIREKAGQVIERLQQSMNGDAAASEGLPPVSLIDLAYQKFDRTYDDKYGGFGSAPKFPRPVVIDFLHHYAAIKGRESDEGKRALAMAAGTLRNIANGGIHDHLGGGFHRYSVDDFWHIPHYEKMLYDQAQLVTAYLDAGRLNDDPFFHEQARKTLAYVSRRMSNSEGGFYSAEDADSLRSPDAPHKTEGAFYIWEYESIDRLLGDDSALFKKAYGVEAKGNFPAGSDPHGELTGTNTLIRRYSGVELAEQFDMAAEKVEARLEAARNKLIEERNKRSRPHLDKKVLTAWNGLMISAFARAYLELGDPEYLVAAERAAEFVKAELYDSKRGVLMRSHFDEASSVDGFASDYAFLISGLLDLYEAGFDHRWLVWADSLQETQDKLFWDQKAGGYFASNRSDDTILLWVKNFHDGAEPSENSTSARNLQRLGAMLEQSERIERSEEILRSAAAELQAGPTVAPLMLVALDAAQSKPTQVVIAGKADDPNTRKLMNVALRFRRPHQVMLLADGGAGQEFLAGHAEFYREIRPVDGRSTAYVCENFVCKLPTNQPSKLKKIFQR